ncbi:ABC transporter substrate-binding protein [Methylobacterium sp. Leaf123]|uniref:ABC transporter substrate-binding protein n=1 Tax=Methylobacterium sp. Leaf123 TaxID=1736264 RepID=UPI00070117AE|nr:ABC transporter substrate-binding protein [Methylobacterium sp. Leaf123]KQQ14812.1 ABC transporter substrate-binding protein [Methylobacterium sp. Leaf123]
MKRRTIIGIAAATFGTALVALPTTSLLPQATAAARSIVFTSWGGTTQEAQKTAWVRPYTKASGVRVQLDGPTDYGKFKAMVESGNVGWDVVDVEYDFAAQAARDGLLEPIDFSVVKRDTLDPRFVTDHAVGSFYYAFVLGYGTKHFPAAPKSWADLFDTKTFPGKRTFYKWSAPGALEIALLADGVAPDKLYPLDLDRAFAKLDTIKSEIIWWSGGAQSQQLLASGEVAMGQFWNGRIAALEQDKQPVGIAWEQNLTTADMLVVPKGSSNRQAAMGFIAAATGAKEQADFAAATRYAPINLGSAKLMDPAIAETLPNRHEATQINLNMAYWAKNREGIGKRWYAWQTR